MDEGGERKGGKRRREEERSREGEISMKEGRGKRKGG